MTGALALALTLSALAVPPLEGPVVDRAGVLNPAEKQALSQLALGARAANGGKGPLVAFLLVPSLEGEAIEDFSIRVAEAWKLGSAERDDGLLFVVSVRDRRMRIEVGGGLEGDLTDAQAGRIIRESLAPAFREGRYGEGLFLGASQALETLGVHVAATAPPQRHSRRRGASGLFFLFFIVLFLLRGLGGRGRGGPGGLLFAAPFLLMGGGRHRGGGFGGRGGFGGGGFGGGGGGFSGGGASGNW